MIKIVFFDVDGTLLKIGEKDISDKTLYALKNLQKKGILLCMATGRSYTEIPHFKGVDFDILLTFNGSYIVNNENVIYKNPLDHTDKNVMIQNLKKMNRAIAISNENTIVANGTDPDLEQYFSFGNVELIISDKFDEISKGEVYQIMCSGTCDEYDMILKGYLKDIEKSRQFYKDLFGLDLVLDNNGNMILTEGLVLQDEKIWKNFLGKEIVQQNNACELYFEEENIEAFIEKLEQSYPSIQYVNKLITHSWGQKVTRFYDLDGNLIEVGTPM